MLWTLVCLYVQTTNKLARPSFTGCLQKTMNARMQLSMIYSTCHLVLGLQVVQAYVDAYGRQTSMIITPTVVKETQAQFNCDRVPGAALENEGGQGSAMAHWEYRWFQVGEIDWEQGMLTENRE